MKRILYLLILLGVSLQLFASDYTRLGLLNEGRRSMRTLEAYKRISAPIYPNLFISLHGKFFLPYEVDTNEGPDKVFIILGELDGKVKISNTVTAYIITNYYGMFSLNRNSLETKHDGAGNLVAERDDNGNPKFSRIYYGYLTDIYAGADIRIWKILMIQTALIFSFKKLRNVIKDTRNIEGISTDDSGDPLYIPYGEKKDFRVMPVFGLYILDVKLFSFQSVVGFSTDSNKVTINENLLTFNFENYIKKAGRVVIGTIIYSHMDEFGVVFRYENLFEAFSFGIEYYAQREYFSEVFVEFVKKLSEKYSTKRVKIVEKIPVNNFEDDDYEIPDKTGGYFGGQPEKQSLPNEDEPGFTEHGNEPGKKVKREKQRYKKRVIYKTYKNKSFHYFLLRLNLARTVESIEINNSNDFVPGIKMGIGYKHTGHGSSGLFWEIYILYNIYKELVIFRHSLNKFGGGLELGVYF